MHYEELINPVTPSNVIYVNNRLISLDILESQVEHLYMFHVLQFHSVIAVVVHVYSMLYVHYVPVVSLHNFNRLATLVNVYWYLCTGLSSPL